LAEQGDVLAAVGIGAEVTDGCVGKEDEGDGWHLSVVTEYTIRRRISRRNWMICI